VILKRLWPGSLLGQMLLSVALALLLAQAIGAALLYRAQAERRDAALVHTAAMRLFGAYREETGQEIRGIDPPHPGAPLRDQRYERTPAGPLRPGEPRLADAEHELREMLDDQGIALRNIQVFQRSVSDDPASLHRVAERGEFLGSRSHGRPTRVIIAALQPAGGTDWLSVRVLVPRVERWPLISVIMQTLLIYLVLVSVIALILRRITRPLKALTSRMEAFAQSRDPADQLTPEGPDDVRRLTLAHNALENRIAALLDEKDVMLGAIGHDLKTPLAALRVRIESVEDAGERGKMAATIEDITRSLDDILSLARVGRPSDPREDVELSALIAQVCEEFEDMGEPVTFAEAERVVVSLRVTWVRRALRNLISNALRYGKVARVSLTREGEAVTIRIEDDGPGIPEAELARMLEPFTRGEPSRSSETGGAGLGLTLARAIAEQHGGTLTLANRPETAGLAATLRLPFKASAA
jgi:signal transduction histidine kinase